MTGITAISSCQMDMDILCSGTAPLPPPPRHSTAMVESGARTPFATAQQLNEPAGGA
jgi:hypothetical protein